jgi:hypothetical protein
MCLTFRNERPYLREWLEFHLLAGVQHFYLYDNRSSDHAIETLRPYIQQGVVDYHKWDDPNHPHRHGSIAPRMDCCARYQHDSFWIAFLDADEFLYSVDPALSLADVLRDYEMHPALGVGWLLYGDSGLSHYERTVPVIERFTRRQPIPRRALIKSIARPSMVVDAPNPHYFLFPDDLCAVDEQHREIRNAALKESPDIHPRALCIGPTFERIRINHYQTKSRAEFDERKRLNDEKSTPQKTYTTEFYERINRFSNKVEDRSAQRFLPELKRRLGRKKNVTSN